MSKRVATSTNTTCKQQRSGVDIKVHTHTHRVLFGYAKVVESLNFLVQHVLSHNKPMSSKDIRQCSTDAVVVFPILEQ